MTSTFTGNKYLEEPANGDYVNLWNIPNNNNFTVIDAALGRQATVTVTGVSTTQTLNAVVGSPITNGAITIGIFQYQCQTLIFTGTLGVNLTYLIPSGVSGMWNVYNATSGAYTLTIASAGSVAGGVTIPQGSRTTITCDGGSSYGVTLSSTTSSPGGVNGSVQYNIGGYLAGSSNLTWTGSALSVPSVTSPASTNLTLQTNNGTTFLTGVSATGYAGTGSWLGIQTTTPIRPLTVSSSTSGSEMAITANGATGSAYINVSDNSGNNGTGYSLYIRGLSSAGSTPVNLNNIFLNANTVTAAGVISGQLSVWTTQTWNSPSRGVGSTYTNSESAPIQVVISGYLPTIGAGGTGVAAVVNGVNVGNCGGSNSQNTYFNFSFIVPPGASYGLFPANAVVVNYWSELS